MCGVIKTFRAKIFFIVTTFVGQSVQSPVKLCFDLMWCVLNLPFLKPLHGNAQFGIPQV